MTHELIIAVQYTDPHEFNPNRFLKNGHLDPDILDPGKFAFGNGRRLVRLPSFILRAFSVLIGDDQNLPG